MRLTASEIAQATGGEWSGKATAEATSFTIDTRRLEPGACFVALRDRRDGHDFLDSAWTRGASVALVSRAGLAPPPGAAIVRVRDALAALGALGAWARSRLSVASVVGITGSAGKTSTKDLLAAAFDGTRRVHASPGSYNNESGLPLTLLGAADDTEVVIAEMGARFAGNIEHLCAIARPDVGVVTNIGLAHGGSLGGAAGVARVKGELLEALPSDGVAVLDADGAFTAELRARTRARVVLVAQRATSGVDVCATGVALDDELRPSFRVQTPWGTADVRLRVRGEHQVQNALMAIAVAGMSGVPLERVAAGLERAASEPWRMQLDRSPSGVVILNDAYNASPTSMEAALRSFARLPAGGRRIAVLGEMLELGDAAEAEHRRVGAMAVDAGVTVLVSVGRGAGAIAGGARDAARERGATIDVVEAADAAHAHELVLELAAPGDAVLVKASRAIGLERMAEALAHEVVRA